MQFRIGGLLRLPARSFSSSKGSRSQLLQTTNPLIVRPNCAVHSNELHLFWAKAFHLGPLIILFILRFWYSSGKWTFNVYSYDAVDRNFDALKMSKNIKIINWTVTSMKSNLTPKNNGSKDFNSRVAEYQCIETRFYYCCSVFYKRKF